MEYKPDKTQVYMVLRHMIEVGPIDRTIAEKEYGVGRLTSRIDDIENIKTNDGKKRFTIDRGWINKVNRYGKTIRIKQYTLIGDELRKGRHTK